MSDLQENGDKNAEFSGRESRTDSQIDALFQSSITTDDQKKQAGSGRGCEEHELLKHGEQHDAELPCTSGLVAISTKNPEPEVTAVSVLHRKDDLVLDVNVPLVENSCRSTFASNCFPNSASSSRFGLFSVSTSGENSNSMSNGRTGVWQVPSATSSGSHFADVGGFRSRDRLSWAPGCSDVTRLQMRIDNMQRELTNMTKRNSEITGQYQSVLGELDASIDARRQLENTLEETKIENARLRSEYDIFAQDKQLLQQQVIDYKIRMQLKDDELTDLREQLHQLRGPVMSGVNSAWADNLLKQWEEVRKDNEALRQECELVREQQQLADGRIREAHEQLQIEFERRRAEEAKHRDERMEAYGNLHKLAQDRDQLHSRLETCTQQLEECRIENTRLHGQRLRMEEDLRIVRQTYDASRTEYQLVMSERDTVLKENQELAEEKECLLEKMKNLDTNQKALDEEIKSLRAQLHQDRRGVESAKERSAESILDETGSPAHIVSTSLEQRSMTSSESEVADITRRALEKEVTELRQRVESMKQQLDANRQENEDARKSRDWAFSERQRIVSERESMRKMCDQLRRERDDAITKLADAIKDSDDLQRQREKTEKELKDLKEKVEASGQQESGTSPSHSRDSAIDTDLAEWEIETLELNTSGIGKENLGLELRGGRDDPVFGTTVPIYVKSVEKGSKFDSVLRVYDCIMQVNDIDVSNMEHRSVVDILHNSKCVKMVIKRRRLLGMKLISVPLDSAETGDPGLVFENGVYISKIQTSSPAAKAGNLAVGDRIIYVNAIPVHEKSACEVQAVVRGMKAGGLVLAVMKSPPVLSPMTPTASFPGGFLPGAISASSSGTGMTTSSSRSAVKKVTRDEGIQTADTSVLHHQKSLLDKMSHLSKIFGKSDKKAMVKAQASIPVQQASTEALRRGSSTRASGAFSSPSAIQNSTASFTATRWWGQLIQADKRAKTGSICSEKHGSSKECSPEQVFQQFDKILEDEQTAGGTNTNNKQTCPLTNKSVARRVADSNIKNSSGGTWPKYRQSGSCEPIQSAGSTVTQRPRKTTQRKPVFPVFPQPPSTSTNCPEAPALPSRPKSNNPASPSVESDYISLSRSKHTPPTHLHNTSYHPQVSSDPSSSRGYCLPAFASQKSSSRPQSAQRHRKGISMYERGPGFGDYDLLPPPKGLHSMIVRGGVPMQTVYAHPVVTGSPPSASPGMPAPPPPYPDPTRMGLVATSSPDHADVDGSRSSINSFPATGSSHEMMRLAGSATPRHWKAAKRSSGYSISARDSPFQPPDTVRLSQGDVRKICIEKGSSCEYLGINIGGSGNGVFVSRVNENSLAARNGIQVGDQILDVCGINMRNADLDHAKKVLRQFGRLEEITLTVQYRPQCYINDYLRNPRGSYAIVDCNSSNSTPRATPNSFSGATFCPVPIKTYLSRESSVQSASTQHSRDILGSISETELPSEPRFVFLKKDTVVSDWGFTLIGGNDTGVFVDDISKDSPAGVADGLKSGDQILEFNGVNFRKLTLEQAYYELQRQCDGIVSILAQHSDNKYQKCKRGAGDSFYVRVNVERQAENTDELPLKFGDILWVDNSVFMGKAGRWRAWRLDQEGRPRSCGIIPSKYKIEEELMLKRSGSEISAGDGSSEGGGSRRGTIRRSLKFIRRSSRSSQHHQRTPSKESKDLLESGDPLLLDELYQRVERLDYTRKRPVLIFGAFVEPFICKLVEEYPNKFAHCVPECVKMAESTLIEGIQSGIYVDHRKRDKLSEVTTVAAVKAIMDKGVHCLLNVSPGAVERLHRLQIYPVVVFVKFKQYKHVKELTEKMGERLNSKQCREFLEHADQVDQQLQTLNCQLCTVTATPQPSAEHTIRQVCQQIVQGVEHEQKKTLWIISSESL